MSIMKALASLFCYRPTQSIMDQQSIVVGWHDALLWFVEHRFNPNRNDTDPLAGEPAL
jgi:hypothetical protein